jgi:hypothetical protein
MEIQSAETLVDYSVVQKETLSAVLMAENLVGLSEHPLADLTVRQSVDWMELLLADHLVLQSVD